jgi:hypothetical protein
MALLVLEIALRRADVRRAVMRTLRIADRGVDEDVRLRLAAGLIAIGDETKAFGNAELLHIDLAALNPSFIISQ